MSFLVILFALILILGLGLVLVMGAVAIPGWAARRREAGPLGCSRLTLLVLCVVFVPVVFILIAALKRGGGNQRDTNDELSTREVRMSVPTLPLPPLPAAKEPFGWVEMGPSRFIVTVLLVDHEGDQFRTLDGGSFTYDWPSSSNPLVLSGGLRGTNVALRPNLGEFFRCEPSNGDPPFVYCSMPATTTNQHLSYDSSGERLALDTLHEVTMGRKSERDAGAAHPKTLADAGPGVRLLVHLTRVDPSDTLRTTSAAEWLSGDAKRLPFHAAGQVWGKDE